MSYATSKEILEKVETLPTDELIEYCEHVLPCVKDKNYCEIIMDTIHKKLPDVWNYKRDHQFIHPEMIKRFRPYIENKSILDIGAGKGDMWSHLNYNLKSLFITDVSNTAVESAQNLLKDMFNVKYLRINIPDLKEEHFEGIDVLYQCTALFLVPAGARMGFYGSFARYHKIPLVITGAWGAHKYGAIKPFMYDWPTMLTSKYKMQRYMDGFKYEKIEHIKIDYTEARGPYELGVHKLIKGK